MQCLDNPADSKQTSTCKKKSLRENSTAMYPDFSMDQVGALWPCVHAACLYRL